MGTREKSLELQRVLGGESRPLFPEGAGLPGQIDQARMSRLESLREEGLLLRQPMRWYPHSYQVSEAGLHLVFAAGSAPSGALQSIRGGQLRVGDWMGDSPSRPCVWARVEEVHLTPTRKRTCKWGSAFLPEACGRARSPGRRDCSLTADSLSSILAEPESWSAGGAGAQ